MRVFRQLLSSVFQCAEPQNGDDPTTVSVRAEPEPAAPVAEVHCVRCTHVLKKRSRSPIKVRGGRARARNAKRDALGRYVKMEESNAPVD